jgi:hypothetical protein
VTTTHIRLDVTGIEGETGESFVRELDRVEGDDHVQSRLRYGTSIRKIERRGRVLSASSMWRAGSHHPSALLTLDMA